MYTGPKSGVPNILTTTGTARDVTIENITFDSIYTTGGQSGMPAGLSARGTNIVFRNNQILNIGYGVNSNGSPNGFSAFDNVAPLATGIRGYMFWVAGHDLVYIGNYCANAVNEHCMRATGNDQPSRILIAMNDFTNLNRTSIDPNDISKGTISVQKVDYAYIYDNNVHDGDIAFGPLPVDTNDKGARGNWCVIEDNTATNCGINLYHGAQHVMIRNNVISRQKGSPIHIDGYSSTWGRGVVDATILNNHGLQYSNTSGFVVIGGSVSGLTQTSNGYVTSLPQATSGMTIVADDATDVYSLTMRQAA
jgi:hypothetical protein